MKRFSLFFFAILFVFAVSGFAQTRLSRQQKKAEEYIRKSEAEWAASVATGDSSVIERILADDFCGVDPKGPFYDKKSMVANTKEAPKYFKSNSLDGVKIRFFGENFAVAQGTESWEQFNGKKGQWVWTDTWVKRIGVWQIVAAQDLVPAARVEPPGAK